MVFRVDSNARKIAIDIIDEGKGYDNKVANFVNGVVKDLDAVLKEATPFDEGNAMRSWHFDLMKPGEREAQNFNTAPYIRKLEHGHSKQAPQGMTIVAFGKLDEIVKRIARITGVSNA